MAQFIPMKTRLIVLGCLCSLSLLGVYISKSALLAKDTGAGDVFGIKTESSIEVRVVGPGVSHPGVYEVPIDKTLLDLINQAGTSDTSNRHFSVTRRVDGDQRVVVMKMEGMNNPALQNFQLHGGDVVFAGELLL